MTTDNLSDDHAGDRPSWDCEACAQPWPCANAKTTLLQEFRGFPSVLAVYMSAQMCEAILDLTAHGTEPPNDLYERFLSWIQLASTEPRNTLGPLHTHPQNSRPRLQVHRDRRPAVRTTNRF
jgi:hypothetical protein